MESILTSIKKLLGITEEYTHFDADIITHINTVFMTLAQIGVGPAEGFMIEDESAYWEDFETEPLQLQAVKSYIFLRVKLLFDPPLNSATTESMNRAIAELEWRLNLVTEMKEDV